MRLYRVWQEAEQLEFIKQWANPKATIPELIKQFKRHRVALYNKARQLNLGPFLGRKLDNRH